MEMSFLDKIAKLRAGICDQLPTPEVAVLARTVERLRRSNLLQKCLQVGETAPDFEFTDAKGDQVTLYGLLEKGPVVTNFFRGFWCSFCKTEIEAYEKIQGELHALGCRYLAITPQKMVTAIASTESFQVIFDQDNLIARLFGIVYALESEEIELFSSWGIHLDQTNQSVHWELPLPAAYIIAPDRTIRFQFVDVDFRSRCCPDQLVEEIRQVGC